MTDVSASVVGAGPGVPGLGVPGTMSVARLYGPGDIRVEREPLPDPVEGTDLVRVTAVGLCGSDLHWYAEAGIGDARLDRPLVVGHEFAGVIEGGPRHGLRVAVDPAIPCEHCEICREGYGNLCPDVRFAGHGTVDGGLREFITWPAYLLRPLPDTLTDADGALLEPLGVGLHSLDLGHLRVGATVAVIGCGPIGLLILQLAYVAGASRVFAVEPLEHRLLAARALGADDAVAPEMADRAYWREVAGRGADVVFEVAGTEEAVELAMTAVRPGGRVVLVGIPSHDRIAFSASTARRKGVTIALVRRMNRVYDRAIDLVARRRVDLSSLVTESYPLGRVAEAFDAADRRTGIKVVVEPATT
ncbi:zinc-dependent alcohol dehydrogenase [Rugosimonospora africana]|uniref:Sorbitol dehydrogenase n=1 Tax=Rugosimonospora africana TaxID=556532 RepID=A0A8J3QPP7_9ACTN|nr:zinc-binding dehydrogenase [Rugosimonospora africana]GIH14179.1 sorbitol dehydrogenase [Rugosimonospora africana]